LVRRAVVIMSAE